MKHAKERGIHHNWEHPINSLVKVLNTPKALIIILAILLALLALVFLNPRITGYTVLDNGTGISAVIIVGECGDISIDSNIINDVDSNGTCFNITASNVVLDCKGYQINYSNTTRGHAIVADSVSNITIRNCNIVNVQQKYSHGINFTSVTNSLLKNNTILVDGNKTRGIYFTSSTGNNIINNTVQTFGFGSEKNGILLDTSSDNNIILNNTILTASTGPNGNSDALYLKGPSGTRVINNIISGSSGSVGTTEGILIDSGGTANLITNNTINTTGAGGSVGVLISGASHNIILNNSIRTLGAGADMDGIIIQSATNNTITNNTIRAFGTSTGNDAISFRFTAASNKAIGNTLIALSSSSAAIRITSSSNNNNITGNNLTSNSSYALIIEGSANSWMINNTLSDPVQWISTDANSNNTFFINTTFVKPNTTVRFNGLLTANGSNDVTATKLTLRHKEAYLNSSNLSFMNTSADIIFRDIALTNPEIIADFEDNGTFETCPANICTEINFSNNVFVFNVTRFTNYSVTSSAAADCPFNISSSTTLNSSRLGSSGNCALITADDIFLDCAGFSITTPGHSLLLNGRRNVTIRNCVLVSNTSNALLINESRNISVYNTSGEALTGGNGLSAKDSPYTILENSTGNSSSGSGIRLENSSNSRITNSTGTSTSWFGIFLWSGTNNSLIENSVARSSSFDAFTIQGRSGNNTILNMDANSTTGAAGSFIHGFNNTIRSSTFKSSTNNAFYIYNSSGNTLADITGISTSGPTLAFRNGTRNFIINSTFASDSSHASQVVFNSSFNFFDNVRFESNTLNGLVVGAGSNNNIFNNTRMTSREEIALRIISSSHNNTFNNITLTTNTTWLLISTARDTNFTEILFNDSEGSVFYDTLSIPDNITVTYTNFNIDSGSVFLNSTNLTEMNKTARVALNNIAFSSPQLIADFEDDGTFVECPASICTEISFSSNILIFNVTHFTTYSTQETPSSPSGGGGGGSGGDQVTITPPIVETPVSVEIIEGPTEINELLPGEEIPEEEIEILQPEEAIAFIDPETGEKTVIRRYSKHQLDKIKSVTSYQYTAPETAISGQPKDLEVQFTNRGDKALADISVLLEGLEGEESPPVLLHPKKVLEIGGVKITGWALQSHVRQPSLLKWKTEDIPAYEIIRPGETIDLDVDLQAPLVREAKLLTPTFNIQSRSQTIYSQTTEIKVNPVEFLVIAEVREEQNQADLYMVISNKHQLDKEYFIEFNVNTKPKEGYAASSSLEGFFRSLIEGPETVLAEYYGPFKINAGETQLLAYTYAYDEDFADGYVIKYSLYEDNKRIAKLQTDLDLIK